MSTTILLITRLNNLLTEAVDFAKVQPLPLKVGQETTFPSGDLEYGMRIEKFDSGSEDYLPRELRKVEDLEGFYNFGFDVGGDTQRKSTQDYKALGTPLAKIVASLLQWIKVNNPQVVTFIPDGSSQQEKDKKTSLYLALLVREESLLNSLGYTKGFYVTAQGQKAAYIMKKTMNEIKTPGDFKRALKEHTEAYFFLYSNGCESCREIKPQVRLFESTYPQIPFYNISTYGKQPLVESLKLEWVPTLIHLKDGKVKRIEGSDKIVTYINESII